MYIRGIGSGGFAAPSKWDQTNICSSIFNTINISSMFNIKIVRISWGNITLKV